jgi:hypothetical protein
MMNNSGSVITTMPVRDMSMRSKMNRIAIAFTASEMIVIAPCANISLRLSMSFVMRVIKRPTGIRSKNAARCAST